MVLPHHGCIKYNLKYFFTLLTSADKMNERQGLAKGSMRYSETYRGKEYSLQNHGSRQILGESRNLGVAN